MNAPVSGPPADDQAARGYVAHEPTPGREEVELIRDEMAAACQRAEVLSGLLRGMAHRASRLRRQTNALIEDVRAVRALADDAEAGKTRTTMRSFLGPAAYVSTAELRRVLDGPADPGLSPAPKDSQTLDGPAEAPADPNLSEWQTQMRGFLGKRVEVVLNEDPRKVVVGVLHHFDTDGQVYVEDEDGSWGWAWPCLDIAVVVGPAEAAEPHPWEAEAALPGEWSEVERDAQKWRARAPEPDADDNKMITVRETWFVDKVRHWFDEPLNRDSARSCSDVAISALHWAARGVDQQSAGSVTTTPAAPGYPRIAEAITAACEAADIDLTVVHDGRVLDYVPGVRWLATVLDKAGLIDWAAFQDGAGSVSTTPDPAAILRAAAAGRREYAVNAPDDQADALDLQAATLDQAADIAGGDYGALYGWLPSWRWTRGMTDRLHDGSAALAWADVAALAAFCPSEEDR